MSEHFPRNAVSASFWCGKCQKFTQHRIDDKRKGPCLACIDRLDKDRSIAPKSAKVEEQQELFG